MVKFLGAGPDQINQQFEYFVRKLAYRFVEAMRFTDDGNPHPPNPEELVEHLFDHVWFGGVLHWRPADAHIMQFRDQLTTWNPLKIANFGGPRLGNELPIPGFLRQMHKELDFEDSFITRICGLRLEVETRIRCPVLRCILVATLTDVPRGTRPNEGEMVIVPAARAPELAQMTFLSREDIILFGANKTKLVA